mmetsp:Transcript_25845/g.78084  ORF Transcript_25845/g.78084 Transcript_25845/m.78084 type:complete len:249 (-) Transcript_25845:5-751(-)
MPSCTAGSLSAHCQCAQRPHFSQHSHSSKGPPQQSLSLSPLSSLTRSSPQTAQKGWSGPGQESPSERCSNSLCAASSASSSALHFSSKPSHLRTRTCCFSCHCCSTAFAISRTRALSSSSTSAAVKPFSSSSSGSSGSSLFFFKGLSSGKASACPAEDASAGGGSPSARKSHLVRSQARRHEAALRSRRLLAGVAAARAEERAGGVDGEGRPGELEEEEDVSMAPGLARGGRAHRHVTSTLEPKWLDS